MTLSNFFLGKPGKLTPLISSCTYHKLELCVYYFSAACFVQLSYIDSGWEYPSIYVPLEVACNFSPSLQSTRYSLLPPLFCNQGLACSQISQWFNHKIASSFIAWVWTMAQFIKHSSFGSSNRAAKIQQQKSLAGKFKMVKMAKMNPHVWKIFKLFRQVDCWI